VAMVTATSRRLGVADDEVEVVLGGGLFDSEHSAFGARVEAGVRGATPRALFRRLDAPPVLGAALLGLDAVATDDRAEVRLRAEGPARPTAR